MFFLLLIASKKRGQIYIQFEERNLSSFTQSLLLRRQSDHMIALSSEMN